MAKNTVNKVEPGAETDKNKKEEKGRKDFSIKEAKYRDKDGKIVTAVNGDGLLIAVPAPLKDDANKVIYAGFNPRKHNPLNKGVFASIAVYMRYQAYVARIRAAILIKSAEEKELKAANIEKFGDEATRRKVAKVAKMKQKLAVLEQQLKEDGVDTSEIDS